MTQGLELREIEMVYKGHPEPALSDFSVSVRPGERISMLGPSGSGKSTALLVAGGHLQPTKGTVLIDGRDVTRSPADKRNVRSLFQSIALFPHMTVADNVAFPLRMAGIESAARRGIVHDVLSTVQLTGLEHRRIQTLSGGQRQRVALARAVVSNPKAVLLDEPLAALDRGLRKQLLDFLIAFFQERKTPVIFVGHDQEEAFAFGTRIVILNEGRIEQAGTPNEILRRPISAFVAEFLETHNVFHGKMDGRCCFRSGSLHLPVPEPDSGDVVAIGLRPEALELNDTGSILCTVLYSRRDHERLQIRARLSDGRSIEVNLSGRDSPRVHAGNRIVLAFDPSKALLFIK